MKKFQLKPREENFVLPVLLKLLTDKPKTNNQLIKELDDMGIKITPIRVRAIIHHIRNHSMECVLSNRWGYYISYDKEEIAAYCISLELRADSIKFASDGIKEWMKTNYAKLS